VQYVIYRYENVSGQRPLNYDEMIALTKAHVFLGRGGLALVSSGSLFSWPEELCEVLQRFEDETKVDWIRFMDHSNYR